MTYNPAHSLIHEIFAYKVDLGPSVTSWSKQVLVENGGCVANASTFKHVLDRTGVFPVCPVLCSGRQRGG